MPDRSPYHPHIQLVPVPLWGSNMRKLMPRSQWRKLREALLDRHGLRCAICGAEAEESRTLNAHEEWVYDEASDPATARLTGVTLICWHCHHVGHWGVTKTLVAQGNLTQRAIDDTIAHFCRLNKATKKAFEAHEKQATKEWERRSQRKWRIDYGPFLPWVAATYEGDPLNSEPWSPELNQRWADAPIPSMIEIVCRL